MKVSVVTPTCDRPEGIRITQELMKQQTFQPHEWIVADSGHKPAKLHLGQTHIHSPMPSGAKNLAQNIMNALERVTGDIVIIWEDDDYYFPNHIEECVRGLVDQSVYGCNILNYFNIEHRCWIQMQNKGSALCQTAFRKEHVDDMYNAAANAYISNDFGIDRRFWENIQHLATGHETVIGIKGLPGTKGLGIGHRPNKSMKAEKRWFRDQHMLQLANWIGADARRFYSCF